MTISSLSVRRPVATVMFYLAVILLGFISLQRLAVDLFPDLNYPRLLVRTRWRDAAPQEVAEFITRPVEEAVSAVSGLKQVTSRSRQSVSLITLEFYWGTNMDYASLAVREKLDEIRLLLPEDAERPHLLRLDPSARPIMEIAVSGIETSRLTDLARQVIRRRLEQIHGVGMVEVVGGIQHQIVVEIDPRRLLTQNLLPEDIVQALQANNISSGGGTIKKGRYRFTLFIDGEFHSLDDIKQVAVIPQKSNIPILLGDIARVDYHPIERKSIVRYNGQETVALLVTKEAGSNTVWVSQQVEESLKSLQTEYPDLSFFIVSRQADFIRESIRNVFSALIVGGVLAFLVLFLFLHNFRHPLNIGLSMPVSVIATFILMDVVGVNLNMMSLGGLALGIGMLVDNSIVVLENIFRLREEGADLVAASVQGAREVAMPVMASTLTTCAVFIPVIYVKGIAGQLFRDQSLTVTFSLFASLLVSLTLLPVLTSQFKGRMTDSRKPMLMENNHPSHSKIARATSRIARVVFTQSYLLINSAGKWVKKVFRFVVTPVFRLFDAILQQLFKAYHTLLLFCLNHKLGTFATILFAFFLTILAAGHLDRRFLPPFRQTEVRYHLELPADATLYQTAEVVANIEHSFLANNAVQAVFSRIGPRQSIFQVEEQENVNQAVILVKMKPQAGVSFRKFMEQLRESLPEQFRYNGYFESGEISYTSLLGLQGSDLQINVQGASTDLILPVARQIRKQIKEIPGVKDVFLSYRPGITQYQIRIDRRKAAMYGVNVRQIATAIKTQVSGTVATRVREYDRAIDVLVRPGVSWRDSWNDIYLHMLNVNGQSIPLKELIHYRQVRSPEQIFRQNQTETIQVLASIQGSSRHKVIEHVRQMLKQLPVTDNVRARIGGRQDEITASFSSLKMALLLSIALVYMILAAQFESFRYPLLILLAIPFGLIGGVWMLVLTGNSLNVIAGIGFVVLTGIVVNDAIIKVDFILQARRRGLSARQAILDASQKRFRPILITTVTTVFGLLPMALSGGSGAALRQSLALVIIGGLSLATFLTLVVIPVGYEFISRKLR